MYGTGKTLAHTGATLTGIAVLGVTIPWLAIVATIAVILGAVTLRFTHKVRAPR